MLPATKSQPKEMIPIVDKPTIQYVIEEAVESGITDILMVIGKGKRAIEEHFDRNYELEIRLEEQQRFEELASIRKITNLADIHFVWQKELRGLGDAIRYGRFHVGNEPFAVLLGDSIMESDSSPVTKQLIDIFSVKQQSVVAVEKVAHELVGRYGIVEGNKSNLNGLIKVDSLIEKPLPEDTTSDFAIAGRYVFTPEIFTYLNKIPPGVNNELQLTDAMALMLVDHPMFALHFEGKRHDIGNTLDFIKSNVLLGLKRKEISAKVRDWIIKMASELSETDT